MRKLSLNQMLKFFGIMVISNSIGNLGLASPPFFPVSDPNSAEGACEMVSAQVMNHLLGEGGTPVAHQLSNLSCGLGQHTVVLDPLTGNLYDYTFSQMLSKIDFESLSPEAKKIYREFLEKGHSNITEANFKYLMELYKNNDPTITHQTLLKPTVDLLGPDGRFPPEDLAKLLNKENGPNAEVPHLRDPDVPRYKMVNINGRMALALVDKLGKVLNVLEWITDPMEALEEKAIDVALTNPVCLIAGSAAYCMVAPYIAVEYQNQLIDHYLEQSEVWQNAQNVLNQEPTISAPLGEVAGHEVERLFSTPLHELTEEDIQFMISTGDPIFGPLLAQLGVGQ
jgi:hypothetical protein